MEMARARPSSPLRDLRIPEVDDFWDSDPVLDAVLSADNDDVRRTLARLADVGESPGEMGAKLYR